MAGFFYKNMKINKDDGSVSMELNKMLLYQCIYDGEKKGDIHGGVAKLWRESNLLHKIEMNERIFKTVVDTYERLRKTLKNAKGGGPKSRIRSSWQNWVKPYIITLKMDEVTDLFFAQHYGEKVHAIMVKEGGNKLDNVRTLFKNIVENIKKDKKYRGAQKRKLFSNYSEKQKKRIKEKIMVECNNSISTICESYNISPVEMEIMNLETNKTEKIKFNDVKTVGDNVGDNIDDINMLCLIKDKFRISDTAYKELSMIHPTLPRFNELSKLINKLDENINILPTPGSAAGVQISFKASLVEKLRVLMTSDPELHKSAIQVKFSGDGTWIGKRLHVVNFTYTIINEGRKAMSERGNYCLAIVKVKEEYDALRESLSDICQEMMELKEVMIDGKLLKLEYFLGGDWKFLACVCGIGAATSNHACIWCRCHKNQRGDRSLKWSLLDKNLGARTVEDIENCCKGNKFSVKHPPLFKFIPLCNVIIDNLHLFLRISDVLIARLIQDLRVLDLIDKKATFSGGFNRQLYGHMAKYETFLREDLKLSFEWRVNKDSNKLEYRDLTGPEKIMLFKHIDIAKLIPANDVLFYDCHRIQKIWDNFFAIINMLKADSFTNEGITTLKNGIHAWFNLFLNTYQTSDCTPYIHALVHHVPEFIELHGNVNFFNQQGLEKFNDVCTKNFFRGTNMRGMEALKQLMSKRNRIQFLEDQGFDRDRRPIHCSNCGMFDHNILKCTSPCSNCSETICCRHLVKVESIYLRQCLLPEPES